MHKPPGFRFAIHGGRIRPLALLAAEGKPVILEIAPPVDDLSHRRQGFYERAGYPTRTSTRRITRRTAATRSSSYPTPAH